MHKNNPLPAICAGLLAFVLLVPAARAQETPSPDADTDAQQSETLSREAAERRARHEAQALKWFGMLDADGDGRISLQEAKRAFIIKPSLREYFERTDTDGDGYLTKDEVRAEAERKRQERKARRLERALQEKERAQAVP